MDLAFPKSQTDNKGLIRKDAYIVKNIPNQSFIISFLVGTTRYVNNLISYSSSYWWCSDPVENSFYDIEFKYPIYILNYSFEVQN